VKVNWLKYRKWYFGLSGLSIAISVFGLIRWGLPLGVDFRGGTVIEYSFPSDVSTEELDDLLQQSGVETSSVQSVGENYLVRLGQVDRGVREKVLLDLKARYGEDTEEISFENVGPMIGSELIRKTMYAVLISAGGILLWVAFSFKNVKYGVSAVAAMFHDSFILLGSFTILGHFLGAEVDFLFVTALLTTLSFSVHDTIVVYDRIREISRKHGGEFSDVANNALNETMRRSINNSVTIALMLLSLATLGGSSVHWFSIALLIGTILGTYSSPFVAVPLLVTWLEKARKKQVNT